MRNNRRNFLKNTALGAAGLGLTGLVKAETGPVEDNTKAADQKLRKVWIASITQKNMYGANIKAVTDAALKQMEIALPYAPDVFCLPEVFHAEGVEGGRPPLAVSAEDGSGKITAPFQAFAKKNNCYVICPIYTVESGKYYNAAVVIDRQGKTIGEYRKIRLTVGEMDKGLTPGPINPPVFETDFGRIGIQICYDIEWPDAWVALKKKGAEIVFWPSAFAAGMKVNTKAWDNQYCVVSSTRKGTTKIVDILGEDIAVSGIYSNWGICTEINLEKAFLHSYPQSAKFPAIQKKYGRKINIYSLHEEEYSVIESLSPDLKVADILKEFDLITYREQLRIAEERQGRLRV